MDRSWYLLEQARSRLDDKYHSVYPPGRQRVQNLVVLRLCASREGSTSSGPFCRPGCDTWCIFTAGPMGVGVFKSGEFRPRRVFSLLILSPYLSLFSRFVGKTTCLKHLRDSRLLPLEDPVVVDLDEIRSLLPEATVLSQHCPMTFGSSTQREAGTIAELCMLYAAATYRHVIFEGTLRDVDWYQSYFLTIKPTIMGLRQLLASAETGTEAWPGAGLGICPGPEDGRDGNEGSSELDDPRRGFDERERETRLPTATAFAPGPAQALAGVRVGVLHMTASRDEVERRVGLREARAEQAGAAPAKKAVGRAETRSPAVPATVPAPAPAHAAGGRAKPTLHAGGRVATGSARGVAQAQAQPPSQHQHQSQGGASGAPRCGTRFAPPRKPPLFPSLEPRRAPTPPASTPARVAPVCAPLSAAAPSAVPGTLLRRVVPPAVLEASLVMADFTLLQPLARLNSFCPPITPDADTGAGAGAGAGAVAHEPVVDLLVSLNLSGATPVIAHPWHLDWAAFTASFAPRPAHCSPLAESGPGGLGSPSRLPATVGSGFATLGAAFVSLASVDCSDSDVDADNDSNCGLGPLLSPPMHTSSPPSLPSPLSAEPSPARLERARRQQQARGPAGAGGDFSPRLQRCPGPLCSPLWSQIDDHDFDNDNEEEKDDQKGEEDQEDNDSVPPPPPPAPVLLPPLLHARRPMQDRGFGLGLVPRGRRARKLCGDGPWPATDGLCAPAPAPAPVDTDNRANSGSDAPSNGRARSDVASSLTSSLLSFDSNSHHGPADSDAAHCSTSSNNSRYSRSSRSSQDDVDAYSMQGQRERQARGRGRGRRGSNRADATDSHSGSRLSTTSSASTTRVFSYALAATVTTESNCITAFSCFSSDAGDSDNGLEDFAAPTLDVPSGPRTQHEHQNQHQHQNQQQHQQHWQRRQLRLQQRQAVSGDTLAQTVCYCCQLDRHPSCDRLHKTA